MENESGVGEWRTRAGGSGERERGGGVENESGGSGERERGGGVENESGGEWRTRAGGEWRTRAGGGRTRAEGVENERREWRTRAGGGEQTGGKGGSEMGSVTKKKGKKSTTNIGASLSPDFRDKEEINNNSITSLHRLLRSTNSSIYCYTPSKTNTLLVSYHETPGYWGYTDIPDCRRHDGRRTVRGVVYRLGTKYRQFTTLLAASFLFL